MKNVSTRPGSKAVILKVGNDFRSSPNNGHVATAAGLSVWCQFRKSQRERYRAEMDGELFGLQAAIDQIGLLGRLITYLV
jgi:hypothetical protein